MTRTSWKQALQRWAAINSVQILYLTRKARLQLAGVIIGLFRQALDAYNSSPDPSKAQLYTTSLDKLHDFEAQLQNMQTTKDGSSVDLLHALLSWKLEFITTSSQLGVPFPSQLTDWAMPSIHRSPSLPNILQVPTGSAARRTQTDGGMLSAQMDAPVQGTPSTPAPYLGGQFILSPEQLLAFHPQAPQPASSPSGHARRRSKSDARPDRYPGLYPLPQSRPLPPPAAEDGTLDIETTARFKPTRGHRKGNLSLGAFGTAYAEMSAMGNPSDLSAIASGTAPSSTASLSLQDPLAQESQTSESRSSHDSSSEQMSIQSQHEVRGHGRPSVRETTRHSQVGLDESVASSVEEEGEGSDPGGGQGH